MASRLRHSELKGIGSWVLNPKFVLIPLREIINSILKSSNRITAQLDGGGERLGPSTSVSGQTTHPLIQPTRSTLKTRPLPPSVTEQLIKIAWGRGERTQKVEGEYLGYYITVLWEITRYRNRTQILETLPKNLSTKIIDRKKN